MATIITFSGLVGTGKSVCARYVSSELYRRGYPVYYLRYRLLSPRAFVSAKKQIKKFTFKNKPGPPSSDTPPRFSRFSLHPSTRFLLVAPLYLLRAYLFFVLVNVRYPKDVVIADRYVYDHLAHYQLSSDRSTWIYKLFRRLLPRPQLPFVLFAGFESVKQARPGYADEYIQLNLENYQKMSILFPETIFVETEPVREKAEAVLAKVQEYLETKQIKVNS